MTTNEKHIVKLVVRFQNAVDEARERAVEGYEMDREFDGGEFSGPAMQRGFERAQARLAERFGFANADLAYGVAEQLDALLRQPAHIYCEPGSPAPIPGGGR